MKGPYRKKIVIGNWKMNPDNFKEAEKIFFNTLNILPQTPKVDVVMCPPMVYLHSLHDLSFSRKIVLGAQNVFWEKKGSFTGEISVEMLKDAGVRYVICGHSERRAQGETNEEVSRKSKALIKKDLSAVVCVGESERDEDGAYLGVLEEEIRASLASLKKPDLKNLIVAYEPLWTIGKRSAMKSETIHEMVIFVRKILSQMFSKDSAEKVRIVYGGSVNSSNIEDIITNSYADGVLPGRASRVPEQFATIVETVKAHS